MLILFAATFLIDSALGDGVVRQMFSDASCTNRMQQVAEGFGCVRTPLTTPAGQPRYNKMLTCGSTSSATYREFTSTDTTCSGGPGTNPTPYTPTDSNRNPLSSWACSKGTDNFFYTHNCITGAPPPDFNPSTFPMLYILNNIVLSSAACPSTDTPAQSILVAINTCTASTSPGTFSKFSCNSTHATLRGFRDATCSVESIPPSYLALGCNPTVYAGTPLLAQNSACNALCKALFCSPFHRRLSPSSFLCKTLPLITYTHTNTPS